MITGGVEVEIPLIDGDSLPIPTMPMGVTEIVVTYQDKTQTARPFDPNRVPADPDDESETHQEGWLLAELHEDETTGEADGFHLRIPTLHNKKDGADNFYDAGTDGIKDQPQYQLYWKDSMGNFQPLVEDTDISIANRAVVEPRDNGGTYYGYEFDVRLLLEPTLWGGYTLREYLENGGSLYITAQGGESGEAESEKTEVVLLVSALRPFDPDRVDSEDYKDHWIHADNRGDHMIITVPTLANKKGDIFQVDGDLHTFDIYLMEVRM